MLLLYKTCDLREGTLACAIPTIVRIAYTHVHALRFSIFKSGAILGTSRSRCACLIRVAQPQLGPAFCQVDGFCSQVPGRQVVSVSSEAGAMMRQSQRGKPFSL